jgi:hypothetical protein
VTAGRLRAALAVVAAVAVLTPAAALAFDGHERHRATVPAAGPVRPPQAAPLAGAPRDAPQDGSQRERSPAAPQGVSDDDKVLASIGAALGQQSTALLAGDAAGFAAPATDPAVRADLGRRFDSLRAMRVATFGETVVGAPVQGADGSWTARLRVTYCFVVATCDPLSIPEPSRWTVSGTKAVLVALGTSQPADLGPRPWEVSALRTAAGKRVIVATTDRYASKLPAMLAAAEKAAASVDRYARWDPAPPRYIVYLAGPQEWGGWYGMVQRDWVAAFAMPLTARSTEVVLNVQHTDPAGALDVLRHELTHVVTLAGSGKHAEHSWWLVEGIAEYVRITSGGHGFDGLVDLRRFVHSGHWAGDVALDDPPPGTGGPDVNGRYAVAYLGVKRLADRFGEDKMLAFFAAVVRDGTPLADAAPATLGVSWPALSADLDRNLHSVAN